MYVFQWGNTRVMAQILRSKVNGDEWVLSYTMQIEIFNEAL